MTRNAQSFTYRDLQLLAGQSTPIGIMVDALFATTHHERTEIVERALDWIVQEFAKTRQLRVDRSEDDLSIDTVAALKAMGFAASHDTQYGGHADIIIEMRDDYLWIGEAKIHNGYDWLLQGFQQLDTRYTTGLPGQDQGGMLIYCFNLNAGAVMDEWVVRLTDARKDIFVETSAPGSLIRKSRHRHKGTGAELHVRHTIFPLYFKPDDK